MSEQSKRLPIPEAQGGKFKRNGSFEIYMLTFAKKNELQNTQPKYFEELMFGVLYELTGLPSVWDGVEKTLQPLGPLLVFFFQFKMCFFFLKGFPSSTFCLFLADLRSSMAFFPPEFPWVCLQNEEFQNWS